MVVALLLAAIWAAVLVPPAVRSHTARKKAFEVSFGRGVPRGASAVERRPAQAPPVPMLSAPDRPHSPAVRRRRRIAGGLLVAMVASGLAGLLPSFRVLLIVNLFVDDSFLFYVALLAYRADQRSRTPGRAAEPVGERGSDPVVTGRRARSAVRRGAVLPELPPVVSIG